MMGMCAMKYDPLFDRMNVNPKGAEEEKKSKNEAAEADEEEEEEDKADSEKKDESKEQVTATAGEADTARPSDQISTDA